MYVFFDKNNELLQKHIKIRIKSLIVLKEDLIVNKCAMKNI